MRHPHHRPRPDPRRSLVVTLLLAAAGFLAAFSGTNPGGPLLETMGPQQSDTTQPASQREHQRFFTA